MFNAFKGNQLGGVMIKLMATRAIDGGFDPRSGQTKELTISTTHAASQN